MREPAELKGKAVGDAPVDVELFCPSRGVVTGVSMYGMFEPLFNITSEERRTDYKITKVVVFSEAKRTT